MCWSSRVLDQLATETESRFGISQCFDDRSLILSSTLSFACSTLS